MQDVTDGAFWTLMHRYGGADCLLDGILPRPRRLAIGEMDCRIH
jgi:hypothetical protein